MRAALYARVSTDDQSTDSQLSRLRTWATSNGHVVAVEAVDVVSGRAAARPGLDRVLAEVRGHHVDLVAAVKVDRLARSVLHLSTLAEQVHASGAGLEFVDQGLRIPPGRTDPTASLLLAMLGAVAEFERDLISSRTREALAHLKAKGVRLGRPRKRVVPGP